MKRAVNTTIIDLYYDLCEYVTSNYNNNSTTASYSKKETIKQNICFILDLYNEQNLDNI